MAQSRLLISNKHERQKNERQKIAYKEGRFALILCSVCGKIYFILPCGKR